MRRPTKLSAIVLTFALVLAACGGGDDGATEETTADEPVTTEAPAAGETATTAAATEEPEETPEEPMESMSGDVRLDGSSTVGPLSEVAAELYMQEQPEVRVTVAISGTGGGFQKFCGGETDANNSSRPIKEDEAEICESNGIAYDFVQVANDALSVVISRENPLECLTVEQLAQIWGPDSQVFTWADVDGLDLPAEWDSEPVTLYGPGSDSGTFDYFTEEIIGESGSIRIDFIDIGEDDLAAVNAIVGDRAAMGYIPFSYYQESLDSVKAVAIDGGSGCVESTPETVEAGTYSPLGRGLFVYFSDTALARPEVVDFAEFYIENAAQIAELAEFVPMTDAQLAEQAAKIAVLAGS